MKLDKLVGDRFKEKPADCVIESHSLMMRGGYMKFVASGIFSQYMPVSYTHLTLPTRYCFQSHFQRACGKNPVDTKPLGVNYCVLLTEMARRWCLE